MPELGPSLRLGWFRCRGDFHEKVRRACNSCRWFRGAFHHKFCGPKNCFTEKRSRAGARAARPRTNKYTWDKPEALFSKITLDQNGSRAFPEPWTAALELLWFLGAFHQKYCGPQNCFTEKRHDGNQSTILIQSLSNLR